MMVKAKMSDGSVILFQNVKECASRFAVCESLVRRWIREGYVSGAGQIQGLIKLENL